MGSPRTALGLLVVVAALVLPAAPIVGGADGAVAEPRALADRQRARADAGDLLWRSPGLPPPAANDLSCQPPEAHPHPVVLVHGTFGDQTVSWNLLAPVLAARGYCVFALDYGRRGTGDIRDSAGQLADFVDRVLEATDAERVSIVGHSQGGMMPRWYIKELGGDGRVEDLVGLAPSNHGTTLSGTALTDGVLYCRACAQQLAGSDFLERLNEPDETPGPVDYTQIATRFDQVVVPFRSAFLEGEGGNTTNVLLQDACPGHTVEHLGIIYDPVALQWVLDALGRDGPADPDLRPRCLGTATGGAGAP